MNGLWKQCILLILLLFLSGFFSSAETALVSCNKIRMRTLMEEGDKNAKTVLDMLDNQSKMLSTILIGNNLVNTFAASITTTIAYSFGGAVVSVATFIITILILIFGEITPKTMATQKADTLALRYAAIIHFLMILLTPIIFFVNAISAVLLKSFGIDIDGSSPTMTENELRTIVDVSHEEGVIEEDEKDLINNVFDFGDVKVKDIMVPRVHVVMADVDSTYDDLIAIFREEQYTRIPIYQGSMDNVIGMINMKDLLLHTDIEHFQLNRMLRKVFFVYENKLVSDLLLEMKEATFNLAIVLDEYGELSGIITLEDILEEIVGEVRDEYDAHEDTNIQKITQRVYDVKGYISLHDLNDALGLDLDSENYDSIGGLVIDRLKRLPEINDYIVLENGIRLQVMKIQKHRIDEVRITLPNKKEG